MIYLGDRFDNPDFDDSTYVWLPFTLDGSNNIDIPWVDSWTPAPLAWGSAIVAPGRRTRSKSLLRR